MKKVLLTAGLVAFASSSIAGSFDGMYAGARLDYAWTQIETEDKAPNNTGDFGTKDPKLKGFEADLFFEQGFKTVTLYTVLRHTSDVASLKQRKIGKKQIKLKLGT